jgi:hypothetical protein
MGMARWKIGWNPSAKTQILILILPPISIVGRVNYVVCSHGSYLPIQGPYSAIKHPCGGAGLDIAIVMPAQAAIMSSTILAPAPSSWDAAIASAMRMNGFRILLATMHI